MSLEPQALDRAFDELLELALSVPACAKEFADSRAEFPTTASGDARAQHSHAEWFLLERHSTALDSVPVQSDLRSSVGPIDAQALRALRESFPAILEVSSVRQGQGAWARDIFGGGEVPLIATRFLPPVAPGDVLVGRLYPLGDQTYCASRAMAGFRNEALRSALHKDAQAAHASHRGMLRLSQAELEAMFFEDGARAAQPPETTLPAAQPSAPSDARPSALARARGLLALGGLEAAQIEDVLDTLRESAQQAARAGAASAQFPSHQFPSPLGDVLDYLGFESQVDLEQARLALIDVWNEWLQSGDRSATARARAGQVAKGDVKEAIAAFDRGRAAGVDLEQLFKELEQDLGLNDDEDEPASAESETSVAPDFPGVVGAMVDEYLWELERESGPKQAERQRVLRELARWGEPIGVFENLSPRQLVIFCCVWLPEWGRLDSEPELCDLLSALRDFCAWADQNHQLSLSATFETDLLGIERDLPRVWSAGQLREPSAAADSGSLFLVRGVEGDVLQLESASGAWSARVDARLAQRLRAEDRLRGALDRDGTLHVYCVYPPQCRTLEARRPSN